MHLPSTQQRDTPDGFRAAWISAEADRDPEVVIDHARSRLINQEGGLSVDLLRIDVSRNGSTRDCLAEGHRWAFQVAGTAAGGAGSLVCSACGQGAPTPAAPAPTA